jgi:hypothetical protein
MHICGNYKPYHQLSAVYPPLCTLLSKISNLEPLDTNEAYKVFSNKLREIYINNEVKEKTVVIPASHIIRDPWMTKGLITSSRNLNKLFRNKI